MADKARKSAKDKAQEIVDLEQRKVDGLTKRKTATETVLETITSDLKAAKARLEYAKQHPVLAQPTEDPKVERPAEVEPPAPGDTLEGF